MPAVRSTAKPRGRRGCSEWPQARFTSAIARGSPRRRRIGLVPNGVMHRTARHSITWSARASNDGGAVRLGILGGVAPVRLRGFCYAVAVALEHSISAIAGNGHRRGASIVAQGKIDSKTS